MINAILLASAMMQSGTVPNGIYSSAELCKALHTATGNQYVIDASRNRYPLYIKSNGSAAKVKELAAAALRGKWEADGERKFRLVPDKFDAKAEFEIFRKKWEIATANTNYQYLPVEDLYRAMPGKMLRYHNPPTVFTEPLAKNLPQIFRENTTGLSIKIFRRTDGSFLVNDTVTTPGTLINRTIQFNNLPPDVRNLIGKEINEDIISIEQKEKLRHLWGKPLFNDAGVRPGIVFDKWNITVQSGHMLLEGLETKLKCDVAVVIPDSLILTMMTLNLNNRKAGKILGDLGTIVDWTTNNGAVIGRLTGCELQHPSQLNLNALKPYFRQDPPAVITTEALLHFAEAQTPAANYSGIAILSLAKTNLLLERDISDYPYNLFFLRSLKKQDLALLSGGKAFQATQLSAGAQKTLQDWMLNASMSFQSSVFDPALWPLDLRDLTIQPNKFEKTVAIDCLMRSRAADAADIRSHASKYDSDRRELGREPTYLPAKLISYSILIQGSADSQHTSLGFHIVPVDPDARPVPWQQLPADIAKAFGKALEEYRRDHSGGSPQARKTPDRPFSSAPRM